MTGLRDERRGLEWSLPSLAPSTEALARRNGAVACFGEVLMRLSPPQEKMLSDAAVMDVFFGGAESNVAIALSGLGHRTEMLTTLPHGPLGDAALRHLKGSGVGTEFVNRREGRLGLYFLEPGYGDRAGRVIYDRCASVFAHHALDGGELEAALSDCCLLHISGINAAIGGRAAATALDAMAHAENVGLPVSFDFNFRPSLWLGREAGEATATFHRFASTATVMFANRHDISMVLGQDFGDEEDAGAAALERFPRLRVVAGTQRSVNETGAMTITGRARDRKGGFQTQPRCIANPAGRVGSGDAFAAGILDGLLRGRDLGAALERGLAMSALKHTVAGDAACFDAATVAAVEAGVREIQR